MDDRLHKKIAIGYFWSLIAKWMNRLVGVVSMLILVRLLSPTDFGIAALTNIVIALFVMMSEVGTEKYVIKAEHCTDGLLNSAWSLNLLLKCLCALFVASFSGLLAEWIEEPELKPVLLICSVIPVLGALKNIGLVHYERDLNYYPLTRLSTTVKLAVFPITICLALWYRNYWALVVGIIVNELFTLVGSYMIHPYRPHWSIKGWRKQWHFSKWMMVSTISGYIRSKIDALLLGRFLSSGDVGVYRVSQEFAWLPFSELIAPATSSLYSGISKISQNKDLLHDSIAQYLILAYLLVVPSSFGIFALNHEFVVVILGESWVSAAPIMGLLSLLMLSMPLNIILQIVLVSLSKIKYLILIDVIVIGSIVIIFATLNLNNIHDLVIYTQARVFLLIIFVLLLAITYKLVLGFSIKRLLTICFFPVVPGLAMLWVLEYSEQMSFSSELLNLVVRIGIGAAVFLPLMLIVLHWASKASPDIANVYTRLRRIYKQRFVTE